LVEIHPEAFHAAQGPNAEPAQVVQGDAAQEDTADHEGNLKIDTPHGLLPAATEREQIIDTIDEVLEDCNLMMRASDMRESAEYAADLLEASRRLDQFESQDLGLPDFGDIQSRFVACVTEAQLRVQGR
jgi:hypothetical protein